MARFIFALNFFIVGMQALRVVYDAVGLGHHTDTNIADFAPASSLLIPGFLQPQIAPPVLPNLRFGYTAHAVKVPLLHMRIDSDMPEHWMSDMPGSWPDAREVARRQRTGGRIGAVSRQKALAQGAEQESNLTEPAISAIRLAERSGRRIGGKVRKRFPRRLVEQEWDHMRQVLIEKTMEGGKWRVATEAGFDLKDDKNGGKSGRFVGGDFGGFHHPNGDIGGYASSGTELDSSIQLVGLMDNTIWGSPGLFGSKALDPQTVKAIALLRRDQVLDDGKGSLFNIFTSMFGRSEAKRMFTRGRKISPRNLLKVFEDFSDRASGYEPTSVPDSVSVMSIDGLAEVMQELKSSGPRGRSTCDPSLPSARLLLAQIVKWALSETRLVVVSKDAVHNKAGLDLTAYYLHLGFEKVTMLDKSYALVYTARDWSPEALQREIEHNTRSERVDIDEGMVALKAYVPQTVDQNWKKVDLTKTKAEVEENWSSSLRLSKHVEE